MLIGIIVIDNMDIDNKIQSPTSLKGRDVKRNQIYFLLDSHRAVINCLSIFVSL